MKWSCFVFLLFPISTYAKWNFQEKIDPFTDEDSSYSYVKESSCSYKCGSVVVRRKDYCVVFNFGDFLSNKGRPELTFRVDKNKPRTVTGSYDTEGTSVFICEENGEGYFQLLSQMLSGEKLAVKTNDYKATSHIKTFNLEGSNKAISQALPQWENKHSKFLKEHEHRQKLSKKLSEQKRLEAARIEKLKAKFAIGEKWFRKTDSNQYAVIEKVSGGSVYFKTGFDKFTIKQLPIDMFLDRYINVK